MLSAKDIKQQYLNANAFILASSVENSPNSMGEAMLLGCPVVASNVGGIPSMVKEGESALLFERLNADELAEKICDLFESRELCERLSKGEKVRGRINHDREKNFSDLMEIYNEICH